MEVGHPCVRMGTVLGRVTVPQLGRALIACKPVNQATYNFRASDKRIGLENSSFGPPFPSLCPCSPTYLNKMCISVAVPFAEKKT